MKKIVIRIFSIYKVLTCQNFILIHDMSEIQIDGKSGRQFKIKRRTDYTDESDWLTVVGASLTLKEKIK